jgi:hypothetical protein
MAYDTQSHFLGLAAAAVFALGGCAEEPQVSQQGAELEEQYEALYDHKLLELAEARALPDWRDCVDEMLGIAPGEDPESVQGRRSLDALDEMGIMTRPVRLPDGSIWKPASFESPPDCDDLYSPERLEATSADEEDQRFDRCLEQPRQIDFTDDSPNGHLTLVLKRLHLVDPETVDAEGANLNFDGTPAWHCGTVINGPWCEACTLDVFEPEVRDTPTGGETTVSGRHRTRDNFRWCSQRDYHPVVCWGNSSWGVCNCIPDKVQCGPCVYTQPDCSS